MKEIAPLLEKLAKQLGTTVEYLWGVLVRQAMIASCVDILQYIILGVATYFFIKISKKYWSLSEKNGWDNIWVIIPGMVGIALLIIWITAFFCIQNTISGFLNPEYWALQKILGLIGSAK